MAGSEKVGRGRAGAALLGAIALAAPALAPGGAPAPDSGADGCEEARAIVERADRANTPPALVETARMTITDERGRVFERRVRLWAERRPEGDVRLLRFLAPDEIRGAGLLTREHPGGEDEQWFYLPATRRIRRIAGADRRNRFLGTEFLYEDLQGFHPEEHRYRLLRREEADGELCHVIEASPRDERSAARSAYSRERLWIGARTDALRRAELFDREGRLLRVLTVSGLSEVRPGLHLPERLRMENVQNGRSTTIVTIEREIRDGLPRELFTRRELRRRLRPEER